MNYQSFIFTLFGNYDKRQDSNKDVNGKGTLERFNEIMGHDLDTNLIPFIDNLLVNTLTPKDCLEKFIPYIEDEFGVSGFSTNMAERRKLLGFIQTVHKTKGTARSLRILLKIGGIILDGVDEDFLFYGFDSDTTWDDTIRRLDSDECNAYCVGFRLRVSGHGPMSDTVDAFIRKVIAFSQPIDGTFVGYDYENLLSIKVTLSTSGGLDAGVTKEKNLASELLTTGGSEFDLYNGSFRTEFITGGYIEAAPSIYTVENLEIEIEGKSSIFADVVVLGT